MGPKTFNIRKNDIDFKEFNFDRVFPPESTQESVFSEISQFVQSALDGYNCCIFAYGQTGSGKTFTMEGPSNFEEDYESRGMIARTVEQIFNSSQRLKDQGWVYHLSASFIEIYVNQIRDLLDNEKKEIIEIDGKNTVQNLKIVPLNDVNCALELLKKAQSVRKTAKTNMNDKSSRSHSIFQLNIFGHNNITGDKTEGCLNLVDLAGSENLERSGVTGQEKKEAITINQSLLTLSKVMNDIALKKTHIGYRDSKLTLLLRDSLGGNSKTLMFVNISPAACNVKESISSLTFAMKVNNCEMGVAKKNTNNNNTQLLVYKI